MISELKNNILLIDIAKSKHVETIALRTLKPLIENWSHTTLSSDIVIFGDAYYRTQNKIKIRGSRTNSKIMLGYYAH